MTELTEVHFEIIDRNRARRKEQMKKSEKKRFDQLKQIGCIACLKKGRFTEPVIHHIRKHTGMGLRPKHEDTIPLCPQHHNMGNNSVHLNKKLFYHLYGTEAELLEETNEKIKQLQEETLFYEQGD